MKQFINKCHIEGRVFSHTLQKKISGEHTKNPGTEFIRGAINVATDEEGINIVPVNFTYVTEFYSKSGKPNDTYKVLEQIMDNDETWEKDGKDQAPQVRIDGDVEINDFPGRDGQMVEAKRVRGSFVHFANGQYGLNADENQRNTFECDMLIAATIPHEVEDGDDYLDLRGYFFNFRGALIPVVLSVRSKGGINYFEEHDISNDNPMLTKVWGNITSSTIKVERETESAFGETKVDTTTRTFRSWDVVGCSAKPYEWNDESTITIDEFKTLLDERAQTVAAAKQRAEEFEASKNKGNSAFTSDSKPASSGAAGYKF